MTRPDLPSLRAALWTQLSLRRLRRDLRGGGIAGASVPSPPELPDRAVRGVHAVLRRRGATCLERALVLQKWLLAHGESRDVVVGVTSPKEGFAAHAWLDGDPDDGSFHELERLAPR